MKKFLGLQPPKDETVEENRENLQMMGVPVKMSNRVRKSKFSNFNLYSKEKGGDRKEFKPVVARTSQSPEPVLNVNNPYAGFNYESSVPDRSNPYAQVDSPRTPAIASQLQWGVPATEPMPKQQPQWNSPINTTPLTQPRNVSSERQPWTPPVTPITRQRTSISHSDGYSDHHHDPSSPSMSNNTMLNPYRTRRSTINSRHSSLTSPPRDEENPLLESARLSLFKTTHPVGRSPSTSQSMMHSPSGNGYDNYSNDNNSDLQSRMGNLKLDTVNVQDEDLNLEPNYDPDDLNLVPQPQLNNFNDYSYSSSQENMQQQHSYDFEAQRLQELEQAQREEDEDVDRIKQDIKFTKQQSVASTRNTMRMASEAEASGLNTLGILGSQSEKLYTVERDLLLAKTQNVVATDKVKEMAKLDRSFMLVHVSNPFNSKRRMQRQEDKIRQQKEEDNLIQQKLREQQYRTERNIISNLTLTERLQNDEYKLDVNRRVDQLRRLEEASRYQFEQDSEDDEMEMEISKNLDSIANSTKRLQSMARTIGSEVDSQQKRWRKVEQDTDDLEMEVHLNNHRINGVMK